MFNNNYTLIDCNSFKLVSLLSLKSWIFRRRSNTFYFWTCLSFGGT